MLPDLVRDELQATLGITSRAADTAVEGAVRSVTEVPRLLTALRDGQLDLARVEAVLRGTQDMDRTATRAVVDTLLDKLDADGVTSPWEGPSPRAWRQRITTAAVKVEPELARARTERAVRARCVRTWSNDDGTATFQATGPAEDIVTIEQVVSQLALRWGQASAEGTALTMDQRRFDSLVHLFETVAAGGPLPSATVRREREIGLVLHSDAFFRDGPAQAEPGELRGLGAPVILDPATAREHACAGLSKGRSLVALLVGADGDLQRLVRLTGQPVGGWTRERVEAGVREALPDLPELYVDGYAPTPAISEHVRAARPRCSGYDCARAARRCDLDHDEPYPRGPTAVGNLDPKCRREHLYKTYRLWRSRLHADGSVRWTTLLGTQVTVRHEPLPGTEMHG